MKKNWWCLMPITFPNNHLKINGKWDGIVFPGGALHALPIGDNQWDVSIEILPRFGALNKTAYNNVIKQLNTSSNCSAEQIREFFSLLNENQEIGKNMQTNQECQIDQKQETKFSQWLSGHLTAQFWQPFKFWKIRYLPNSLKDVVEYYEESEEEFKIENFVFTIWALNGKLKKDGTFDKIKFSPYTIVPFIIDGQILDRELVEFNTIEDVNKHGIAITRSYWVESGPHKTTTYYRVMSSVQHIEPTQEKIEALRRDWFLQNP